MANQKDDRPAGSKQLVYSPTARQFHWGTAALVLIMIPLGFLTTYEGPLITISEAVNGRLQSTHKLIGFALLWLMIALVGGAALIAATLGAIRVLGGAHAH